MSGEIFQAVNGQLNATIEEGPLDLAGKSALSTDLTQRLLIDVSLGRNDLEPDVDFFTPRSGELVADHPGLDRGQLAAASANQERCVHRLLSSRGGDKRGVCEGVKVGATIDVQR